MKFQAQPKFVDEMPSDLDIPLNSQGYVEGYYVDGFIVGDFIETNEEYTSLEWWCPVDVSTLKPLDGFDNIKTRKTVSISELKASMLAIQSIAKKHLNKQSDYGGYHGGVNNTCKSVLFWIEQLEKGEQA